MSHIFISYSRKDLVFTEKIVQSLAENGLDPWIDWKSIPGGEEFAPEIYRGIEETEAFLFLISPDSIISEWCTKEVNHAVENGKRILPIVIRDFLPRDAHPEISKRHWIYCREGQDNFAEAIKNICETINTDYEWLRFHTGLQVKALNWHRQNQEKSLLLRGRELEKTEKIVRQKVGQEPYLLDVQRMYLEASRETLNRQRRQITISLVFGLIAMATLALFAWSQRNTAVTEANAKATALINEEAARAIAQTEKERAVAQAKIALARQLAAQAQIIYGREDEKQEIAILLAVQSLKMHRSAEAAKILQSYTRVLPFTQMNYKLFSGPVVFSPDGKYVASGGCDKVDDLYNCTLGIVRIKQMVNGQQIAQITHGLNVPSLAFRPDGKYLVTGGCDRKTDSGNCDFGSIRVWDVANWQEIAHMMQEGGIVSVIFSPDGRYVMSGGEDGTARVWDVTSKQEITRMNHGATEYSYSVALSQDGLYMVSGSDLDNTVRVWEIASGEEIVHMTHESKSGVFAAAFSPNGRYVASGSSDSTARVWDISTGLEIARISHKSTVSSVAFSPDGQYVVSGSSLDNTARVWEATTGNEISHMTHGLEFGVNSLAFSPDGQYVVSGSSDSTARVWDAMTGLEIARMVNDWDVSSVSFSPDGQYVVSSGGGKARVWEATNRMEVARMTDEASVNSLAFSPDGQYVVSGDASGTVRIWTLTGEEVTHMVHEGPFGSVRSVAFSPDGQYVVSGSRDGTARVWQAATGSEISRMTHGEDPFSYVDTVAFSPDSRYVVSGGGNGTARVWDVASGIEIARIYQGGGGGFGGVFAATFSPDGRYVVSGGIDGTARVWEASTGVEIARMTQDSRVWSVAFSPDGQYVISGGCDEMAGISFCSSGSARVWEVDTETEIARIDYEGNVESVTFSPDGRYVVSSGCDKRNPQGGNCLQHIVKVWELTTGMEISRMIHSDAVWSVAFSPDSQYVVSGSYDGTARVWNATTGAEITHMVHAGYVESVAFSPDGRYVVSGGEDGTARVWIFRPKDLIDVACSRVTRNLTHEEWMQYIDNILPYQAICSNLPIKPGR